jgi:hypothetical protein
MIALYDMIVVLCTLAPCGYHGHTLHIPVPEVGRHWPEEAWPRREVGPHQILFVPMPRRA